MSGPGHAALMKGQCAGLCTGWDSSHGIHASTKAEPVPALISWDVTQHLVCGVPQHVDVVLLSVL